MKTYTTDETGDEKITLESFKNNSFWAGVFTSEDLKKIEALKEGEGIKVSNQNNNNPIRIKVSKAEENKIKTLEQFFASSVIMSIEDFSKKYNGYYDFEDDAEGLATVKDLTVFDGWHINNMVDGSFEVCYDRSVIVSDKIEDCIKNLWDGFGKYELLTEEEIDDDRQGRAKAWLDKMEINASLDELTDEEVEGLTKEQAAERDYILQLF